MTMHLNLIDYGFGRAQLWSAVPKAEVERTFYKLANQCFGIRKSLAGFTLVSRKRQLMPSFWRKMLPAAAHMLKHNGDTIVFDAKNKKLKSEWD